MHRQAHKQSTYEAHHVLYGKPVANKENVFLTVPIGQCYCGAAAAPLGIAIGLWIGWEGADGGWREGHAGQQACQGSSCLKIWWPRGKQPCRPSQPENRGACMSPWQGTEGQGQRWDSKDEQDHSRSPSEGPYLAAGLHRCRSRR